MATNMPSGQSAGRPQPQTSVEPAGGPFIRHSQPGYAPQYVVSGSSFGQVITQPLVARPGYFRSFRVTQTVAGTTGTVTMTTDSYYALNSLVTLRDAFGTPLIVAPGYEATNLIPCYSGGFGLNGANFASNLPSYSAPSAAGNFSYSYALPLEFAKGYGVLSGANASLLPTLQFNLGASSAIYSTGATTTSTTIQTQVDSSFYWLPEGVAVEPPGLGTTRQWILQQLNPTVPSNGSARLQFPRLGGYLDTIIVEARDSTGARVDVWPGYSSGSLSSGNTSRMQLYVDGVPLVDATTNEWLDDMAINFGVGSAAYATSSRQTGVIALSRKTSLNQANLGLLDTGEIYLSSNPGTLLEIQGAPWGTFSNSPATISALVGQIVPSGSIIQGLPEV
jgi:hypothetical protein